MLNFRLNTNRVEQDTISQETSLLTLYPLETDHPVLLYWYCLVEVIST